MQMVIKFKYLRHERRHGVRSQLQALNNPCCNRQHILQRAANLHADHVCKDTINVGYKGVAERWH